MELLAAEAEGAPVVPALGPEVESLGMAAAAPLGRSAPSSSPFAPPSPPSSSPPKSPAATRARSLAGAVTCRFFKERKLKVSSSFSFFLTLTSTPTPPPPDPNHEKNKFSPRASSSPSGSAPQTLPPSSRHPATQTASLLSPPSPPPQPGPDTRKYRCRALPLLQT